MNTLELAKQGDAKVIAALMNRHLQPKGITAKTDLNNGCLQVILESAQVPEQEAMVAFVRKGITSIGCESIKTVKVYGQQTGEEVPVWSEDFEVITEIHPNKSQNQVKRVTATQKTARNVQMLATKGKTLASTASANTLFVNNSTRSWGWLLFAVGSGMMGIGLIYDPTVSSGELGIDRSYNIGAINIKSTYTNTGGFIAVCGAIFATCSREQRRDDSAGKK